MQRPPLCGPPLCSLPAQTWPGPLGPAGLPVGPGKLPQISRNGSGRKLLLEPPASEAECTGTPAGTDLSE